MAEQRSRAKADAAARKSGHADLSSYRAALDEGGPVHADELLVAAEGE